MIVQTQPARELPDPFDRIKFRAVRREIVEYECRGVLLPPGQMHSRAMVLCVVADHNNLAFATSAEVAQSLQELPKAFPIESARFPPIEKTAIAQPDRAKVPHAASGRLMVNHRIFGFWRDPNATARAVLLKVYFIQGPQIDGRIPH